MKSTNCPFRHVRGDKTIVCKHWLRGLCKKGDGCEFLHEYDMSKMPECYSTLDSMPVTIKNVHFYTLIQKAKFVIVRGTTEVSAGTDPLVDTDKYGE